MELTGIGAENKEAFAPLMCGLSLRDHSLAVGAVVDDEPAGVVLYNELGGALMTEYIYVVTKFRRRGVGRALIERVTEALGDARPVAVHANYPEQCASLQAFFLALGFKIYRDGRAFKTTAKAFLDSPSFKRLIEGEPAVRVMQTLYLSDGERKILKKGMDAEDLDPAILDDTALSDTFSLVTINAKTAKPVACILCEERGDQIAVLYLVNFSHDSRQLVDLFHGFHDAVLREGKEGAELLFVTMDARMEKLLKSLTGAPDALTDAGNVISAVWMPSLSGGDSDTAVSVNLSAQLLPGGTSAEKTADEASLFAVQALSKTQRTKRGRKFERRAALQVRMRRLMPQFYDSIFVPKDTALTYSDEKREDCIRLLQDLLELDPARFDYASDEAFADTEVPDGFIERFSTLRSFKHVDEILACCAEDERIASDVPELKARAALITEILTDYDNRMLLLQSPYYALLAGRDFDSVPTMELLKRRGQTEDPNAREYLDRILAWRERGGFGRGVSAADRLAELL